jgi:hypothetical protein
LLPQGTLLSLVARTSCLLTLLLLIGNSQYSSGNARELSLSTSSQTLGSGSVFTRLPPERRSQLETKLRKISGLPDLRFADGVLRLNSANISGGSKSARALLEKALHGTAVIVIEDASRRPDVVFARVGLARDSTSNVFVLQLDFADFEFLMGDEPALKAFDVGWAFLHELDHVVEDSKDSNSRNEIGECEVHINQMREECSLPLRADYFHTFLPRSTETEFTSKFVRLPFVQKTGVANKQKRYWVIWDAGIVGGLEQHPKTWSLTSL